MVKKTPIHTGQSAIAREEFPMQTLATGEPLATSSSLQPKVYIVDDDPGMRKSLRWLVETLGVGVSTFPSAASFLDAYEPQAPGCLVLDVVMPEMTGLELQRELRRRGEGIPAIIMTGYGSIPSAVDALQHGAFDFLEKPLDDEVLLEQVRRALAFDERRRRERRELELVQQRLGRLSPRENEVLEMVIEGLSSKEIAKRLKLSFKTVEAHRLNLMKKMEAERVAELVRMVVSARL
jgi:two-component system, LuxR family, response regulator FixJ